METIKIAGVECRVDKLSKLSYEQIMSCALNTSEFYGKKGAKEAIDKELRANGFKPTKAVREQIEANQSKHGGESNEESTSKPRKRNNRKGKGKVEKR